MQLRLQYSTVESYIGATCISYELWQLYSLHAEWKKCIFDHSFKLHFHSTILVHLIFSAFLDIHSVNLSYLFNFLAYHI